MARGLMAVLATGIGAGLLIYASSTQVTLSWPQVALTAGIALWAYGMPAVAQVLMSEITEKGGNDD